MKQVLYFSAPWCMPCKKFQPVIQSLQSEMSITKIDISSSPKTAEDWNVRSIPTILIIKKGVERGRLTGVQTEAAIKDLYNKV